MPKIKPKFELDHPLNRRGYVTWPILNLLGPIHISGMAEDRAVKFCTQVCYMKSYQKNEKSPQKGRGYGHVTYVSS